MDKIELGTEGLMLIKPKLLKISNSEHAYCHDFFINQICLKENSLIFKKNDLFSQFIGLETCLMALIKVHTYRDWKIILNVVILSHLYFWYRF